MFGTIGHARLEPGRQSRLEALNQEWQQTIRPQIPGEVVQFIGSRDGQPDELVFVALVQEGDLRTDGRKARARCLVPPHGRAA